MRRWSLANSLIGGILGLGWLLLRSGLKPSRFAYPCQQAALSAATLAFGAPLVAMLLAARRQVSAAIRSPQGIAPASCGLVAVLGSWAYFSQAAPYTGPVLSAPRAYRADVFHVTECPQDPVGDRFGGIDNLIQLMGSRGLKFYESATASLTAGPDGILAPDDVVVIKINYQWDQRGGTNVDVLRGLVRRIVDHLDSFTGEIVVCENAQFNPIDGFDRASNNAQDQTESPHDVVSHFQGLGVQISHYDWTARRYTEVDEFSAGDMTDGYVCSAYDARLHGKVSYPKFRTFYGTHISLAEGVWDSVGETYDRDVLKLINVPVLKSHHAVYGATACVKNYMGVVTGALSTNSHAAIAYGLLGSLLGEIQPADLNILDCIWINANPFDGPWTSNAVATRRDELVAGVDPVAADIWAVKNILIPAFEDNGFSAPWPSPSADPDDPASSFRIYLDRSMNYILAAGYSTTNNLAQIDATSWNGVAPGGDMDLNRQADLNDFLSFVACFTGQGATAPPAQCGAEDFGNADLDGDGDVDLTDFMTFAANFGG